MNKLTILTILIALLQQLPAVPIASGLRAGNEPAKWRFADTLPQQAGGEAAAVSGLSRPQDFPENGWLSRLIAKIWIVESGGRAAPPDGDGGKAAGPLQLHKAVVDDVNRYYGMNYHYEDRRDSAKAKQIAKLYITMWMAIHRDEIAARIFNGGPRGWERKSTEGYWGRIREVNE